MQSGAPLGLGLGHNVTLSSTRGETALAPVKPVRRNKVTTHDKSKLYLTMMKIHPNHYHKRYHRPPVYSTSCTKPFRGNADWPKEATRIAAVLASIGS
jgi:hypothetical protein